LVQLRLHLPSKVTVTKRPGGGLGQAFYSFGSGN
jgi:hypothetical protein